MNTFIGQPLNRYDMYSLIKRWTVLTTRHPDTFSWVVENIAFPTVMSSEDPAQALINAHLFLQMQGNDDSATVLKSIMDYIESRRGRELDISEVNIVMAKQIGRFLPYIPQIEISPHQAQLLTDNCRELAIMSLITDGVIPHWQEIAFSAWIPNAPHHTADANVRFLNRRGYEFHPKHHIEALFLNTWACSVWDRSDITTLLSKLASEEPLFWGVEGVDCDGVAALVGVCQEILNFNSIAQQVPFNVVVTGTQFLTLLDLYNRLGELDSWPNDYPANRVKDLIQRFFYTWESTLERITPRMPEGKFTPAAMRYKPIV